MEFSLTLVFFKGPSCLLKFLENLIGLFSWVRCKSGQEPNPEEGACQHLEDLGVVILGMRLVWWEGWRPKFLERKHIEPTCLSVNGALDHRPGFPLLPSHSPSRGLTQPCQETAVLGFSQLLAARCAPHKCPAQPAWLQRPQISSPNINSLFTKIRFFSSGNLIITQLVGFTHKNCLLEK